MHRQQRGKREQRNPEIVYRQTETELDESDSEIHGIPRDAIRPFQNELRSGLPRNGALACTLEKNARRSSEAQADYKNDNATNGADRPVDRSSRRLYEVLKSHAQKNPAQENEGGWKPDLCAALTRVGLRHATSPADRHTFKRNFAEASS